MWVCSSLSLSTASAKTFLVRRSFATNIGVASPLRYPKTNAHKWMLIFVPWTVLMSTFKTPSSHTKLAPIPKRRVRHHVASRSAFKGVRGLGNSLARSPSSLPSLSQSMSGSSSACGPTLHSSWAPSTHPISNSTTLRRRVIPSLLTGLMVCPSSICDADFWTQTYRCEQGFLAVSGLPQRNDISLGSDYPGIPAVEMHTAPLLQPSWRVTRAVSSRPPAATCFPPHAHRSCEP